jgi:hypothetical protein
MVRGQGGQATIEWTALILVAALVLGALGYVASRGPAWSFGKGLADAIFCAALDSCPNALDDAYGDELAKTVRRYAPNIVYERRSAELPIDFRRCRNLDCSNGSDRAAPIDESALGLPVTAFTHVVDRRGAGGPIYVQYWLYFPESFTGGVGRRLGPLAHRWPGYHPDDWEGYQVKVSGSGAVFARATAHGSYRNFEHSSGWGPWTGWYRISGGSHAGHLVRAPAGERTTPARDLRLVPLERLESGDLERFAISPPWRKDVYIDPESASS